MKLSNEKMIIVALILVILYLLYRPRIEGFTTIPEFIALEEKWKKDFGPDGVGEPTPEIRKKYEIVWGDLMKDLKNIEAEKSSHHSKITTLVSRAESIMKDMETDIINESPGDEGLPKELRPIIDEFIGLGIKPSVIQSRLQQFQDEIQELEGTARKTKIDSFKTRLKIELERMKSDKLPVEITQDPELDPKLTSNEQYTAYPGKNIRGHSHTILSQPYYELKEAEQSEVCEPYCANNLGCNSFVFVGSHGPHGRCYWKNTSDVSLLNDDKATKTFIRRAVSPS